MTKRDFELIARVIRYEAEKARERKDISAIVIVSRIATHMSGKLAGTNPHFDVDRFLIACGVET